MGLPRIFSYRLADIYKEYGDGNLDEFGDDFINVLSSIQDKNNVEFELKTDHDNPFYHTLNIVTNVSEDEIVFISSNLKVKLFDIKNG